MTAKRTIVSLCDHTHTALYPWRDAGWDTVAVDLEPPLTPGDGVTHWQTDVCTIPALPETTAFVLAWPPCTHLARSGARWWAAKGPEALAQALAVVNACRTLAYGRPWILENPVGRLSTLWRKPDVVVDPWQFAYLSGPEDAYTKKTCLWLGGGANPPVPGAWDGPIDTKRIHYAAPGPRRGLIRSATPLGLARAIFNANAHM